MQSTTATTATITTTTLPNLPWDGSFLPLPADVTFNKTHIVDEKGVATGQGRVWQVNIPNYRPFFCHRRTITTSYPAIIDELKPIFDLRKVGTHRVTYNKKVYLLQRMDSLHPDSLLNKITDREVLAKLKSEVQEIYAFRDAVGLSRNTDNCIVVGQSGSLIYPVSYLEQNSAFSTAKHLIPATVRARWFGSTGLSEVYQRMLRIRDLESYPKQIFELKNRIRLVIERVDPEFILYCSLIVERISNQLILSFLGPEKSLQCVERCPVTLTDSPTDCVTEEDDG